MSSLPAWPGLALFGIPACWASFQFPFFICIWCGGVYEALPLVAKAGLELSNCAFRRCGASLQAGFKLHRAK